MDALYQSLERNLFGMPPRASIPLKPGTDDTRALVPANSPTKAITSRLATALIAAASAQQVPVEAGAVVRRVFSFNRSTWAIENGCGQDLLSAGAAELISGTGPKGDAFRLTTALVNWIVAETTARAWRVAQAEETNG